MQTIRNSRPTLTLVSGTPAPAIPVIARTRADWESEGVGIIIPAGSVLEKMGVATIVVPFGDETQLHITGKALKKLDLTQDNLVQGWLAIRRGAPGEMRSIVLEVAESDDEPLFQLRWVKGDARPGSLCSMRVQDGTICIQRYVQQPARAEEHELAIAA